MSDVKTILENLGYKLFLDGHKFYRCKPIYRNSDNNNSLRVNRKNGWFIDFGEGIRGSIVDLVALSLNLKKLEDAKEWLAGNQYNIYHQEDTGAIIEYSQKIYPETMLDKLIKDHTYWNKRGIDTDTVKRYEGGIAISGSMENRYTFPIRDKNKKVIGFVGRDLTGKKPAKWKICGPKSEFCYPYFNISECRDKKQIIIVESIGDCLALGNAGINNVIVIFGISLSEKLISLMAGICPQKIFIALNNDDKNNFVGQKAAVKIEEKLSNFFNPDVVVTALPTLKDFGDMSVNQIIDWKNQYGIN